ncbi:agmatine deiminase family protein [Polyangium aurulentum]|uniref:agmatine deiminase family protein n=1 Tax=Polyangium aurulentum TaxID=2567896 RepID=UPI0010AEC734|nr:agmatine deiminase family protein [Polyangium aurulentum]UQA58849.1 agmatine deiminase family protein [Polyangium aurulentum]
MQKDGHPHKLQPAEWAPHAACWVAWPSHADLWLEQLAPAREAFVSLCRAIDDGGRGERLEVLVPTADAEAEARRALEGTRARFHRIPFGDIWLRDTAPIFLTSAAGEVSAACFAFNGWGGKYVLEGDDGVARAVARASGKETIEHPFVLEGGSVDVDGEGTVLTTRQCLLNPNRNPGMSEAEVEAALARSLGADKVLWLGDGLLNDHTDGHVDTVARFVRPGVVVVMEARDADDPNREVLAQMAADLEAMTDARGRRLEVVRIPSPGRIEAEDGRIMPASYVNFYISNTAVVVPTYGARWDDAATRAIAELFPGRRTMGVNAKAILAGGGAFHCITQQQPRGKEEAG